jgi:SAM-dependent methyltransferase
MDKAESLRDEYRIRFAKTAQYRNNVWKILCDDYFSAFVSREAHVLDLGSGWGEFINNVQAARKYAMDLNPDAGRRLSGNTHFIHQDCSEEWQVRQESLDVVFTSNFLEHLPDKAHVERTLAQAHRCLKDDGLIICLGPNIKYVPGPYWDFWDHFIPLTELSLSEVLKMKGFNIESCIPRFLPYSMSTGGNPPLFFVRLYLKLAPLWPLFGKQFLVVARKKICAAQGVAANGDSAGGAAAPLA